MVLRSISDRARRGGGGVPSDNLMQCILPLAKVGLYDFGCQLTIEFIALLNC